MSFPEAILDLLYPPKCPFCGKLLEKGQLLCPECQNGLPWLTGTVGERKIELTGGCVSVAEYDERVKKGVHAFKFHGRSARSVAFGLLIAQCVKDHDLTADLVSWPPLSKKRLRERGYDQARLLAEKVGKELGLPVVRTLQKEHRPAQSGLDGREARRTNAGSIYRCRCRGIPGQAGAFGGRRPHYRGHPLGVRQDPASGGGGGSGLYHVGEGGEVTFWLFSR